MEENRNDTGGGGIQKQTRKDEITQERRSLRVEKRRKEKEGKRRGDEKLRKEHSRGRYFAKQREKQDKENDPKHLISGMIKDTHDCQPSCVHRVVMQISKTN